MKRRNLRYVILVVVLAFISLAVILQGRIGSVSSASGTVTPTGQAFVPVPSQPAPPTGSPLARPSAPAVNSNYGLPGLQPSVSAGSASAARSSFTTQEIASYVAAHPAVKTQGGSPVSVTNVSFLTTREVNSRLNTDLYLPQEQLLCLVQISGNITIGAVASSSGRNINTAYEIFDAHSGNLLAIVG